MDKPLQNQVAIVTGGNSGIGRAICIDLAQRGAKVMILARNEAKNEETRMKIEKDGGYAEAYSVDVSNKSQVDAVVDSIYEKHGQIDILVSNAGNLANLNYITNMPEEDWDAVIKTHLYGTYYSVKAVGDKMKARKYGRIVLTSSLGGVFGMAGNVNYAASKHGIVGMMYTLAKEFGPYGITVNAIQPGVIETPMAQGLIDASGDRFAQEAPVKRTGKPEDVAYAASFFCDPKASFITGVAMRVDGGYIIQSGMDVFVMDMLNSMQ